MCHGWHITKWLDVLPTFTLCYTPGVDIGDCKALADFFVTNTGVGKGANLVDIISGEPGHTMRFAVLRRVNAARLLIHIMYVVSIRTKP